MKRLTRELRQAWRSLVHRPAYLITCAATLTLVLGANAAMFAVVNATLLRPMPFDTDNEVVRLFSQPPGTSSVAQRNPLQQMEVSRLREHSRSLARLEGFYLSERVVTRADEPAVATTAYVTPGLFEMLAAPIAHGRAFLAAEGQPGHLVAVVSDSYWRDHLGAGGVLGTRLILDGQVHTIVGILSPAFAVPFVDAQIYTPLVASAEPQPRSPARTVQGLAELAPGVSIPQARDELAAISRRLEGEFPRTHSGWTLGVETAREWQYGAMRSPLLMLFASTAFVLLIACINIGNLTSAHVMARSGDLTLRLALGASKTDLLRLQLAELLIVCASGLIPGLVLAWIAVPALLAIDPAIFRTLGHVSLDWRVQVFSVALAVLSGIVATGIPMIRAMRGQAANALAASGPRTTASPAAGRIQRGLVAIEVGLCLALLMAGGVLIDGVLDLSRRGPGYESAGVLTAQIRLPEASYRTQELRATVVQRMLDTLRRLPGVESASTTLNNFEPGFSLQTLLTIKGRPTPDGQPHTVQFRRISSDYFKTMRVRMLRGRVFTDDDVADRPQVAMISRTFADKLFPGVDPVGQVVIRTAPNSPELTIVGVVDDVLDVSVTQTAEPTVYLPFAQNNNFGTPIAFVIRTTADPVSLVPAVREALRRIDGSLPLRRVQPLEAFVRESAAPERFRTTVLGMIALLGLVLAVIGIAGVTYRGVVSRTKEFAVRLALGSRPVEVVRMVLLESMRDVAIGSAAGLAAGAALCGVLARSLENVGALNAVTTGTALGLVAVAGVASALLPALRVGRVKPADVLRN